MRLYELANGNRLPYARSRYVTRAETERRLEGGALPRPERAGEALAAENGHEAPQNEEN